MKKLLPLLILSILIIGCSKNETESKRHIVFSGYNSSSGVFQIEMTDNKKKIEFTLKCIEGTIKDNMGVQKTEKCYYASGDSIDESSYLDTDNTKTKFHFLFNQDSLSISEIRKSENEKIEFTSTYKILSSKVKE